MIAGLVVPAEGIVPRSISKHVCLTFPGGIRLWQLTTNWGRQAALFAPQTILIQSIWSSLGGIYLHSSIVSMHSCYFPYCIFQPWLASLTHSLYRTDTGRDAAAEIELDAPTWKSTLGPPQSNYDIQLENTLCPAADEKCETGILQHCYVMFIAWVLKTLTPKMMQDDFHRGAY